MWFFFYTKLSATRGVENIWASKLEWIKKGGGGPEGPNQADWGWESNNLFEIKLSPPNLISVLLIVLLSRTALLDLEHNKRPCPIEMSHHSSHSSSKVQSTTLEASTLQHIDAAKRKFKCNFEEIGHHLRILLDVRFSFSAELHAFYVILLMLRIEKNPPSR